MLYKKIHRQFLREFRVGRKFKYGNSRVVHEVTSKPRIEGDCIQVEGWYLIYIDGPYKYKGVYRGNNVVWLD